MEVILIVKEKTPFKKLSDQVTWHSDYIKGVVDLKNSRMSLGGSLHADGERKLSDEMSVENEYLWGFNLYPDQSLEYESLINIKPKLGNKTIVVTSEDIKSQIKSLIFNLITFE